MKLRKLYKKLLKRLVSDYHMKHPDYGILEIEDLTGVIEVSITDEISTVSYIDTKQSIINSLISAGVLEEGQVIKSEDE